MTDMGKLQGYRVLNIKIEPVFSDCERSLLDYKKIELVRLLLEALGVIRDLKEAQSQ